MIKTDYIDDNDFDGTQCLIMCEGEYIGNSVVFWGKNNSGYTSKVNEAEVLQLYEIMSQTWHKTIYPLPIHKAMKIADCTIDMQRLGEIKLRECVE